MMNDGKQQSTRASSVGPNGPGRGIASQLITQWITQEHAKLPAINEQTVAQNMTTTTAEEIKYHYNWSAKVQKKDDKIICIGFQNVRGISKQRYKCELIKETIGQLQMDGFGMVETQLNWNQHHVRDNFKRDLKCGYSQIALEFASCKEHTQHDRQPGGACMGSCSRLACRLVNSCSDLTGMGRWCHPHIHTNNGKHLTMITVYQVCQKSAHGTGVNTAFLQKFRKLMAQQRAVHPRQQMQEDLKTFILESKKQGDSILLMWDANMSITDPEMVDIMMECGLVDLHAEFQDDGPKTHMRGKEKIEFIFGTPDLLGAKVKVGILNYDEGFPDSDHQLIYIDFLETALLDGKTNDVMHPQARGFNTKDPK
jgi:hypothetical protein